MYGYLLLFAAAQGLVGVAQFTATARHTREQKRVRDPGVLACRVERGSVVVHSQTLRAAASEVAAMVKSNYVDSHAQSEIGFSITWLLNVDLLPRIKQINHYGKGGEISTNRCDEVERAALCLRNLQACLVYVNTPILQDVLAEPAWADRLTPADRRGLPPLLWSHVRPYGEVNLDLGSRLDIGTGVGSSGPAPRDRPVQPSRI